MQVEDLCLYMYVIVDDIWQQIAALFSRPGPVRNAVTVN